MTTTTTDQLKGEPSERGRYVTNLVAEWIANDGAHYETVVSNYRTEHSVSTVADYLIRTMKTAGLSYAPGVPAWHVAQELAPNDYARIDWTEVVSQLTDGLGEDDETDDGEVNR